MAVPSSGELSLFGISREFADNAYTAVIPSGYNTPFSLGTIASENTINKNSTISPITKSQEAGNNSFNNNGEYQNGSEIRFSDFYSYDHDAAQAFTDNNAVAKSITTGSGQAISINSTTDYSLTEDNAFTIGFWIKVGWDNNLNTNVHLFAMNDGSTTGRLQQLRIFYNEANNRLEFRIGHNSNNRSLNFWPLHSHLTATGLQGSSASQYWSSATTANRGNVNGNNYTHLVITKGTATTLAANNIAAYWNGTKLGNAFYTNGNNFGTVSMNTNARRVALGSNAHTLTKCGNNNETKYNGLTIFNKQLSDSEVTTLYGSGSPVSPTVASGIGNLIGYYNFESDGSDTSGNSNDSFTISGNSNIEAK